MQELAAHEHQGRRSASHGALDAPGLAVHDARQPVWSAWRRRRGAAGGGLARCWDVSPPVLFEPCLITDFEISRRLDIQY